MNYIDEDKGFEEWCENNYLPILAQAIWKKLFKRFNRSGWREWVTVDNLTLMADVQIEHTNTFTRNRDKLIEMGLIEYRKGKKGCPNQYKMIPCEIYSAINAPQTEPQTEPQTAVIPKRKRKPKHIEKENTKEKYFEDDGLNDLFLDFLELREKKKAVNTGRAVGMLVEKLRDYPDYVKKAMVEKAIIKSWTSVYPLDERELNELTNKEKGHADGYTSPLWK